MKSPASTLITLLGLTSSVFAAPLDEVSSSLNTTRLIQRDGDVEPADFWNDRGRFRQRFYLTGYSCDRVFYQFGEEGGLPHQGAGGQNLQCWSGAPNGWPKTFDVRYASPPPFHMTFPLSRDLESIISNDACLVYSTYNNIGGKCSVACAIAAMLGSEFCSNFNVCCNNHGTCAN
ncbi:hypothetical protein LTR62_001196 [Meristemomyces frigidus]|uniref:Uncharacterized protein n=1 Tax=Meristemomyces frigidus TaxID=1508187 RepID=A0AAN7THG3_9PEZI|nr:hypothetical protein LTR62_001196 [Meristemomyces frigidus]